MQMEIEIRTLHSYLIGVDLHLKKNYGIFLNVY